MSAAAVLGQRERIGVDQAGVVTQWQLRRSAGDRGAVVVPPEQDDLVGVVVGTHADALLDRRVRQVDVALVRPQVHVVERREGSVVADVDALDRGHAPSLWTSNGAGARGSQGWTNEPGANQSNAPSLDVPGTFDALSPTTHSMGYVL